MKVWKTTVLAIPMVTMLMFSSGFAQDAPAPPGGMDGHFKAMDADGNGAVSREEFLAISQKRAEQAFMALDTDGNGSLSKDEIAAMMSRRPGMGGGPGMGPPPQGGMKPGMGGQ